MFDRMKYRLNAWQHREKSEPLARDTLLLSMQISLIPLMSFSVIVFALLAGGTADPFCLYVPAAVAAALSLMIWLNIGGRYVASLVGTLLIAFAAPWLYALHAASGAPGASWHMLYLSIPVLILSQFVPLRVTLTLAAAHFAGMASLTWLSGGTENEKWILLVFSVLISALGTLINHMNRKQGDRALSNVSLSEATERTLRDFSMHDSLTGLYNRRYLEEALHGYTRVSSQPFTILMVDLDHFKTINDLYGHVTGDQVLQKVAGILSVNHRPTDIACRYGGDEFIVILINCALKDGIRKAETIKQQIAALMPYDREDHPHTGDGLGRRGALSRKRRRPRHHHEGCRPDDVHGQAGGPQPRRGLAGRALAGVPDYPFNPQEATAPATGQRTGPRLCMAGAVFQFADAGDFD